jgi:hypothetical protein
VVGRHQLGDDVILGLEATPLDHLGEVGFELRLRHTRVDLARDGAHDVVRPLPEDAAVFARDAQHLGDDDHRYRDGVLLDQVRPAELQHGIDPLPCELAHQRIAGLDGAWREGPRDDGAKAGVIGRIRLQDRGDGRFHTLRARTPGRREVLPVLGDVLDVVVAADDEESVLLDLEHRRLALEQLVVREWVRDDRGIERVVGVERESRHALRPRFWLAV